MSDELRIEFDPLERQLGNDVDRSFFADIGLAVGDQYLTRLDDLRARTVRNHMRGCTYQLATWFATNWWRLRWEPEPAGWRKNADWRLAHSVAATGGGYVWPDAIFAGDGDYFEIAMSPDAREVPFEPIRYLNHVHARITAKEFERRVDAFMESVLSRLQSLRLKEKSLPDLWAEVLAERNLPSAYQRRKLEALAGFDPDQAPDEFLIQILEDRCSLGKSALEEVAAAAGRETGNALNPICQLVKSRKPKTGGYRASLLGLNLNISQSGEDDIGHPWQKAARLAQCARKQWGFGNKPIKNKALGDLLSIESVVFTDKLIVETKMPFALRTPEKGMFDIYFDRPNPTTRRFAVSRLIGDHLGFDNHERLLPATHARTARQKFQRAFAQEFLCPIDGLKEKMQTQYPDEDDIAEAAKHFHVSPLMVRTTLVNYHELEREALAWGD